MIEGYIYLLIKPDIIFYHIEMVIGIPKKGIQLAIKLDQGKRRERRECFYQSI